MMYQARPATTHRALLYPAAVLSLVAGLVQLRLVPQHFEEWWAYGAFFLVAALAQSLYATVLLLWPKGVILLAGMAGNSLAVLTYLVTRSPGTGHASDIGVLDALVTASGVGMVAALGFLLLSRLSQEGRTVGLVAILAASFGLIHLPHVVLVARMIS
jgi:hypothetical protein